MALLPPLRPALIFATVAIAAAALPRPGAHPVSIAQPRPLVYAGRLVRADRQPLANARVWLEWVHEDGFEEVGIVTTDRTGAFTLALPNPLEVARAPRTRSPAPRWLGALVLDTTVDPHHSETRHREDWFDATVHVGDLVPEQGDGFLAVTVDGTGLPDREAFADPVYPTFRLTVPSSAPPPRT